MKKKGRFVLEAALLVPGICILLVYLVFYTLYAHDYAVCVHAAMESGVKGIYRENLSAGQIREKVEQDLQQKLSERLLWADRPKIVVTVNAASEKIQISATGSFLPVNGIKVQQELYRIAPCGIIRRSRWLQNKERDHGSKVQKGFEQ